MVIRATSLSDVSLIAIVPDSECKIPTLIGDMSLPLGASAAAGAAEAAALALGAAAVVVVSASGPLHPDPTAATPNKQRNEATDQLFISCAPSKRFLRDYQEFGVGDAKQPITRFPYSAFGRHDVSSLCP